VAQYLKTQTAAGEKLAKEWQSKFELYSKEFPKEAKEYERRISGKLPDNWEKSLPEFPADPKGMATRVASGQVINAVAGILPELMGGSADLIHSNNTWIKEATHFNLVMRLDATALWCRETVWAHRKRY
jgi:transketolase